MITINNINLLKTIIDDKYESYLLYKSKHNHKYTKYEFSMMCKKLSLIDENDFSEDCERTYFQIPFTSSKYKDITLVDIDIKNAEDIEYYDNMLNHNCILKVPTPAGYHYIIDEISEDLISFLKENKILFFNRSNSNLLYVLILYDND